MYQAGDRTYAVVYNTGDNKTNTTLQSQLTGIKEKRKRATPVATMVEASDSIVVMLATTTLDADLSSDGMYPKASSVLGETMSITAVRGSLNRDVGGVVCGGENDTNGPWIDGNFGTV